MTHIGMQCLFGPRPGTARRKLKEMGRKHGSVRLLMAILDRVFELDIGLLQVTVQTSALIFPRAILRLLRRHRRGDWGDVSALQEQFNDAASSIGRGTIHSVHTSEGQEVHVLTFDCCCVTRRLQRRTFLCMKSELHYRLCECAWMDMPVELTPQKEQLFPEQVLNALKNVLAYIWSEEVESYQSASAAERDNHILKDASIVTDWLHGPSEPPMTLDETVGLINYLEEPWYP